MGSLMPQVVGTLAVHLTEGASDTSVRTSQRFAGSSEVIALCGPCVRCGVVSHGSKFCQEQSKGVPAFGGYFRYDYIKMKCKVLLPQFLSPLCCSRSWVATYCRLPGLLLGNRPDEGADFSAGGQSWRLRWWSSWPYLLPPLVVEMLDWEGRRIYLGASSRQVAVTTNLWNAFG
jgi:hypothetical protein